MLNLLHFLVAKITASWVGYVLTAVVATAATGSSIVLLSDSGVINVTSGLGQKVDLPFTFKPSALGTLNEVYGSLAAGASAAVTGAGIQLPPLAISNKIAAVSSKIVAEASADKASLQKLSDNVQKMEGFKSSDESKTVTDAAAGATAPAGLAIATVGVATATVAVATETPTAASTSTPTRTVTPTPTTSVTVTPTLTPTITQTATVTPTVTITTTPTPTGSASVTPTVTQTFTPTPTSTPFVNFANAGQTVLTLNNIIPGGPGVSSTVSFNNGGAHPFHYTLTTSCGGGCGLLWTDPTNGLQMAVDYGGVVRNPNNPTALPGGNISLYSGPIQVTGLSVASGVNAGTNVVITVTVWLPSGPVPTGFNALTPNPGNNYQSLSTTVTLQWNASE